MSFLTYPTQASTIVDSTGNIIGSKLVGSNYGLMSSALGLTIVDKARIDFTGTTLTNAAYITLVASLAAECQAIQIYNGIGSAIFLATGAAASEVNLLHIFPLLNGTIMPVRIAAGTRISLKSIATAAIITTELNINFLG